MPHTPPAEWPTPYGRQQTKLFGVESGKRGGRMKYRDKWFWIGFTIGGLATSGFYHLYWWSYGI